MTIFGALLVCFGIFAIGDFLGIATKAKVSSVFVALIIFLVGFMSGIIPKDIIAISGLDVVSTWAAGFLVFHMGTMINIKQLIQEWRTVLLTVLSMVVAGVALLVLIPVIGSNNAIASIPIINGGLIATKMMSDAAMAVDAPTVAAFAAILYAVQKFVGTPIASFFGLKEARLIIERYRAGKPTSPLVKEGKAVEKETTVPFYEKYDKYFTDFVCLGLSALFVFIANISAKGLLQVGINIHYTILCLLFGAVIGYTGLVPPKILEKGKTSGFLSIVVFASIIPSLASISFSDFAELGLNLLLVFVVTIAALLLVFYVLPTGKIVGSKNIAVGIAVGQLLGFPSTYLIANEIAKAVSDDKDEQAAVLEVIAPTYVIAGFASVTTFSVVIAGILAPLIK